MPTLHLHTAHALPPLPYPGAGPVRLAAMAAVPAWLRDVTHGRPDGCFAEGHEVGLMRAALEERAAPLFAAPGTPALSAYRAALDARWATLDLRPRVLQWSTFDGGMDYGRDGYPNGRRLPGSRPRGPVPDGAWLVCTCLPSQGCHLRWLAPHLTRAEWTITLYGEAV